MSGTALALLLANIEGELMRRFVAVTSVFSIATLVAIAACSTTESGPKKGGHLNEGTCGSCGSGGSGGTVNSDGTVTYCVPCEEADNIPDPDNPDPADFEEPTTEPPPDGGTDSPCGGETAFGPAPHTENMTRLQCQEAYDAAIAECNREAQQGYAACDAQRQADYDSCMQGVYQQCGTTSPYHYCVQQGSQQCSQQATANLQSCNQGVSALLSQCRGAAYIAFQDCWWKANNRPYQLWKAITDLLP